MTYLELKEILLMDTPSMLLSNRYMQDELFDLIPELSKCDGFDQHSSWHQYDVLNHIYHVVDGVDNSLPLRLSALFHDIGKPATYAVEYKDGKEIGHFPKHWVKSNEIFMSFASINNIDLKTVKLVSKLILNHDHRFKYPKGKESFEELNKDLIDSLTKEFSSDEIRMLYDLRRADLQAQIIPPNYELDYDLEENILLKKYGSKIK